MNVTLNKISKYPLIDDLEIPYTVLSNWQGTADLLAELVGVPSALIMRVHPREIEVFVSSHSEGNVYEPGERAPLDSGLYCETVMDNLRELLVPDARKDPAWDHNPDIELDMVSYCGLPLTWPTGELFGTICMLDNRENPYSNQYRELLARFRDGILLNLQTIYRANQSRQKQEKAESSARFSEAKYRTLVETVPAVIYTASADSEARGLYVSPQIESLLGFSAEDYQGERNIWLEQLHPEDREPVLQKINQAYKSDIPLDSEYRLLTRQGDVVWVRDEATIIRDESGKSKFMQGVLTNITERKRIEHALTESEHKFRIIFDHASDGILVTDLETKGFYAANQTLCQMLGYAAQELKQLSVLDLHPKEALPFVLEQFEKETAKEIGFVPDIPFQTRDGTVFHAEITGSRITIEGKAYSLGMIRDNTERRQAEAERLQYAEKLQQDHDLLAAISHLRSLYIGDQPSELVFDSALTDILQLTNSSSGYIAELRIDENGRRYQQALAISNVAWNEETRRFYEENAPSGFRFYEFDGLNAAAIVTGGPVIANDPAQDTRRCARLPEGHPSLDTFLGLPLYRGEKIIGSIGLSNCPGGYDEAIAEYLKPLLESYSQLIDAYGADQAKLEAERAVHESSEQLRTITSSAKDAIVMMDPAGCISYWNPAAEKIFDYTTEEALGHSAHHLLAPEKYKGAFEQGIARFLATGDGMAVGKTLELTARRKGNEEFPIEISLSAVQLKGQWNAIAIIRDITERKVVETRLHQASTVFDSSHNGVMIVGADTNIVAVNKAFTQITGYSEADILGKTPRILSSGQHDRAFFQSMWSAIAESGSWSGEIYNRRKNGEIYPQWLSISSVNNDAGELTQYVAIFTDLSQLKHSEYELQRYMHYDPLTKLPNRRLLEERLSHALERARRRKRGLAVMLLDLDRFKEINESFGMTTGDALIQEVAQRVSARLRKEDTLARLGGDELLVVLEDAGESHHVLEVAHKTLAVLEPSFRIEDNEIFLTASMGISLYPDNADTVASLIGMADTAMYRAKGQGRNFAMFYSDELSQSTFKRLSLEADLRHALERGELELYYQPQQFLADGSLAGLEALMRWNHPTRGMISPGEFIPVAEAGDLIEPMGAWALQEACRQMAAWRSAGIAIPRVAVNLSPRQIGEPLVQNVTRLLQEHALPASALELEITESAIMDDPEAAGRTLAALNSLNVELAIDDFGTGYSSLAYLQRFKVQRLKIDRAFVSGLPGDENQAALCRAIISMAEALRLETVAEGIETPEQRKFLEQAGCNIGQGFLLSRPVPVAKLEGLIQSWQI
ncbi:MAG: PAS domain S-box protein [Sedimenticola sp.]